MVGKKIPSNCLRVFIISFYLFFTPSILLPEENKQPENCFDLAFDRVKEIQSLPCKKYLYTLDGQNVLLSEFYSKCLNLFPQCCLFPKFYYWQSEIREVVSNTNKGMKKHKIRLYIDCISAFCTERCDAHKTHGDVAEFYDQKGIFMGLAVYMGDGKYCPLPYDGYKNSIEQ